MDYANFLLDCFNISFFHDIEQYLKLKNLTFIVIFILHNAPGHVQALVLRLLEYIDQVSAKVHHPTHSATG
jgi:hypothetical protein